MEVKQYEFKCGLKAMLKKGSWGLHKKVLSLLTDLELKGFEDFETIKFKSLVGLIVGSNLIERLFDIILVTVPEDAKRDYDELETSEVLGVVEDFFTENPDLLKVFGIGKSEAGTLLGLEPKTKDTI